jgi:diguanylate cyclase (GGDEF)-like protein/PAS domain S-box-containing protein
MVVVDHGTRVIALVNAQAEQTFGYGRDELLGQTIDRLLLHPDRMDRQVVSAHLAATAQGRKGEVLELTGLRRDGGTFPMEVVLSELQGDGGHVVAAFRDVSARRRAERDLHLERERAQVTLESIGDAVITYDTGWHITSLNPVAEALTGWTREDAQGRPYAEVVRLLDPATGTELGGARTPEGDAGVEVETSAVLLRRDGDEIYVDDSDSTIRDSEGTVIGGVTVLRDITEAHMMRQRMAHLARHDYLTGLPNRALLEDRLSQALAAVDEGASGAVLFVDLDLFKHINDSLGHPTGDRVLQEVARRLVEAVRPGDTVSRQGGDEFVLLVHGLDSAEAGRLAAELIRLVEKPIEVDGRALHLSASVGVALFPGDSRDLGTLIKQADTALYHAKHAGRGRCSLFTAAMGERADQRMRLETDLRAAIDHGQLFLVYQPKVVLPSRRISGMEALVRWRTTDGRVVPPLEFIPLAEETGLITAIDGWVLTEACRRHRAWLDAGLPRVPLAINLSLARFEPERIVARLREALDATGLPPELLEVEFTESEMLGQHARATELVDGLRALGVRLAVDDFGTGYSSLSYLTRYRFDTIKIDRAFVAGLPEDVEHAAVVRAIVGMARTLQCRVVAEGVETDEQAETLLALGCDEMQGYRFSHPLDEAAFETLLRAGVLPAPAAVG